MLTFKQFVESFRSPKVRVNTIRNHDQLSKLLNGSPSNELKVMVGHHEDGTHTIHAWHGEGPDHSDVANEKYKNKYPPKVSFGSIRKVNGQHEIERSNYSMAGTTKTELGSGEDLNNAIQGLKAK